MKTCKRWTPEEDQVLTTFIKETPLNKQNAFNRASEVIGRNPKSCSQRWYNVLSNPESPHYVGTAFLTITSREYVKNRAKETNKIKAEPLHRNFFQKLLKLLKIKY